MAPSDNGFQQMSFVNSIATTKGGRHVEHVAKLMETALIENIKKKNKSGIQIKPHQVTTLCNIQKDNKAELNHIHTKTTNKGDAGH